PEIRQGGHGIRVLRQNRRQMACGAELLREWRAATRRPIDLMKQYAGIDIQKMYPAPGMGAPDKELQDNWTWDTFLKAAEACNKNGHPFALGLSTCTDALNMAGSVFAAYGAFLVNEKGDVTVRTDATRQVLDWFK